MDQKFPADEAMHGENARIAARELQGFLDACRLPPDETGDVEALCNAMALEFPGTTPRYWLWEVSEAELLKSLNDLQARREAERRASTPADRAVAPDPSSAVVRATVALREYVELIVAEKNAGGGRG